MDNEGVKEIANLAIGRGATGVEVLRVQIPGTEIEAPIVKISKGDGAFEIESLKHRLDEWRDAPARRAGVAKVHTLQDFIELVNRHKDEGSAIFGDFTSSAPKLSAVIDYHTVTRQARFCKHRVEYGFPLSVEWTAWRGANGISMPQAAFAAFVEEHMADLASPMDGEKTEFERLFQTTIATPAELVQLSRGMAMTVESQIKDIRVLQSGEADIAFEEVHKDGRGEKLRVPGLFIISIPMFLNGDPVRITARLRYRRQDRSIVWYYQLYRVDVILKQQLEDDLKAAAGATELPAYQGTPEA